MKLQTKMAHPLNWLLEPLEEQTTYLRRKMFGCEAAYLNGRLMLVLATGEEPWNGMMVVTARELHPALQAEWPRLKSHPVLGKWLYISQNDPDFEKVATAIVKHVCAGDTRIGVEPKLKKRKATKSRKIP